MQSYLPTRGKQRNLRRWCSEEESSSDEKHMNSRFWSASFPALLARVPCDGHMAGRPAPSTNIVEFGPSVTSVAPLERWKSECRAESTQRRERLKRWDIKRRAWLKDSNYPRALHTCDRNRGQRCSLTSYDRVQFRRYYPRNQGTGTFSGEITQHSPP